jgi:hypothetical protein
MAFSEAHLPAAFGRLACTPDNTSGARARVRTHHLVPHHVLDLGPGDDIVLVRPLLEQLAQLLVHCRGAPPVCVSFVSKNRPIRRANSRSWAMAEGGPHQGLNAPKAKLVCTCTPVRNSRERPFRGGARKKERRKKRWISISAVLEGVEAAQFTLCTSIELPDRFFGLQNEAEINRLALDRYKTEHAKQAGPRRGCG